MKFLTLIMNKPIHIYIYTEKPTDRYTIDPSLCIRLNTFYLSLSLSWSDNGDAISPRLIVHLARAHKFDIVCPLSRFYARTRARAVGVRAYMRASSLREEFLKVGRVYIYIYALRTAGAASRLGVSTSEFSCSGDDELFLYI